MTVSDLDYWVSTNIWALKSKFGWGDVRLEDCSVDIRKSSYDECELLAYVNAKISYTLGDHYAAERIFQQTFEEFFEEIWAEHDTEDDFDSVTYKYSITSYER